MKALKLIVLLFILLATSNSFARDKKHFVFMLHGINSSPDCFNKMDLALDNVLNRRDHKTEYITNYFSYQTGNDELSTFDFARSFNEHINDFLERNEFDHHSDKISLVMHSQGGLVGTIWLHESVNSAYGTYFHENVDSFITLGTPFWGTSIVLFPLTLQRTLGAVFGYKESKDMLFGSETIETLKRELTKRSSEFVHYLKDRIKVVNVVANSRLYPNVASFSMIEDDIAVPVPSGQMSFYMNDNYDEGIYSPREIIKIDSKHSIGKHYVVKALHANTMEKTGPILRGVAAIPSKCVTNEYCDHPSYQYVWKTLLNKPTHQMDQKIYKQTKSFAIDFNIKSRSYFNTDDLKFKIYRPNGKKLKFWNMRISKVYSREERSNFSGAGSKHHYIFGGKIYRSKNKDRIEKVMVEVSHKKGLLIPKTYEVTVRPHFTTTINTNLNSILNSVL